MTRLTFGDPQSIAVAKKAARGKPRKIGPDERATMQIGNMHKAYGITEGEQCKNCEFFVRVRPGQNVYRKCRVFGITGGPATDWKASYAACGKFKREERK